MKKIISAILSLSLLAGAAAMPAAAAETYSMGDVNMDGIVNAVDAGLALDDYISLQLMGNDDVLTAEQRVYADLDDDGIVESSDALGILMYYIHMLLTDTPVSPDAFFADFVAYRNEMEQSENFDAASDQAKSEAADAVEGVVYYKGEE